LLKGTKVYVEPINNSESEVIFFVEL